VVLCGGEVSGVGVDCDDGGCAGYAGYVCLFMLVMVMMLVMIIVLRSCWYWRFAGVSSFL
jgi:hypothetical protein